MSRPHFMLAVGIGVAVGVVVGVLGSLVLEAAGFTGAANSVLLPLTVGGLTGFLVAGLLRAAV
ncbi:MAG TPA: hypothetical protein VFX03_16560 [Thermomicrobiales bacterium]|nr:hypothetical protein [Thermomicrobiales bacterium]